MLSLFRRAKVRVGCYRALALPPPSQVKFNHKFVSR